jgi:hypothetical protein
MRVKSVVFTVTKIGFSGLYIQRDDDSKIYIPFILTIAFTIVAIHFDHSMMQYE